MKSKNPPLPTETETLLAMRAEIDRRLDAQTPTAPRKKRGCAPGCFALVLIALVVAAVLISYPSSPRARTAAPSGLGEIQTQWASDSDACKALLASNQRDYDIAVSFSAATTPAGIAQFQQAMNRANEYRRRAVSAGCLWSQP